MLIALILWLCAIIIGIALWHLSWLAGIAWFAAIVARYIWGYRLVRPPERRDTGVTYVAGQAWREEERKRKERR